MLNMGKINTLATHDLTWTKKFLKKLYYLWAAQHNGSGLSCRGFDFWHSQFFQMKKIVDVAEVNQQHCLEESGQWLYNVDQTHLLLASGKLVLNKEIVLFN